MVVALASTSCHKAIERAVEKVKFHGIESVGMEGLSALNLTAKIENGTRHTLVLDDARIRLHYDGTLVAEARLAEEVRVEGRTSENVATRWNLRVGSPLALYVAAGRVVAGKTEGITVDLTAKGRGGPAPINISREKMPLSEFLNIFGVELKELTNLISL